MLANIRYAVAAVGSSPFACTGGTPCGKRSAALAAATAAYAAAAAAALGQQRAAHSLTVGASYALDRTFGAAEVSAYTQLTGDSNPIHVAGGGGAVADESAAAMENSRRAETLHSSSSSSSSASTSSGSSNDSSNGHIAAASRLPGSTQAGAAAIVPGMLLASLFPAIIGSNFSGALYATQSLAFRSSCILGEPVRAEVTVVRASGSRVQFETVCRAVRDGRRLVDGTALAIVPQQEG